MKTGPHAPQIQDRERMDQGFSAGWGFHFPPSEDYLIDCHTHSDFAGSAGDFSQLLDRWFALAEAYRLRKAVLFVRTPEQMAVMQALKAQDDRAEWMLYLDADKPDLALVRQARAGGACGLKLHNNLLMKGDVALDIWDQPAWRAIFAWLEQAGMPVLWHVTQRVSASGYHGGGLNSYFSDGQAKGVQVTNEQLLAQFCRILEAYPGLTIIGAHQLYVGLDRLDALMDQHPNFQIDSSIGFFIRWCDTLYDDDAVVYRDFLTRRQDRVLFGTDTQIDPEAIGFYQRETFASHARFLHQCGLDDETLQKISHRNSERLLGLTPVEVNRRYNSRP